MANDTPEIDPESLEHVTEVSVSAGRKKQLDQYEPINEQVTLTLEFPKQTQNSIKQEKIENAQQAARDAAERAVMRRYEEYVREEAFGDE